MKPFKYYPEVGKKLTFKQYLFVQNYMSNGFNSTQAVLASGYNVKSYNSAKSMGCKMLTNVYLKRAMAMELEGAGLTDSILCEMLREAINAGLGVKATNADALKGLEIVMKLRGYY